MARFTICALVVLAIAVVALTAQAPSSPLAVSPDAAAALAARASEPDDGLDVLHVQGHVYLIAGDGGNIAAQIGPDGVILVDAGAGQRSDAVAAAIERLTDQPIRMIVNTSGHRDHAGGNAALAAAGQELGNVGRGGGAAAFGGVRTGAARIAHENLLLFMARPGPDGTPPYPEAAWPTEGFPVKKQLYLNGEGIEALHRPAAYSGGDAIVFFRRSDVIATGAIVDADGFPRLDIAAGGSIAGVIDTLNALVDLAIPPTPLAYQKGGTQLVTGRGRIMDQPDIVAYRDMVTIVRDVVAEMVSKGMTLAQVRAARPARGYEGRYGSETGPWTTDQFIEAVYASLMKGRAQ
jgi:glyoxylase-like metal-dependent hydrolase (beta-lactamase superfamily II)